MLLLALWKTPVMSNEVHTQCVGRETGCLSNLYHQLKQIIGFIYYWNATDTDTGCDDLLAFFQVILPVSIFTIVNGLMNEVFISGSSGFHFSSLSLINSICERETGLFSLYSTVEKTIPTQAPFRSCSWALDFTTRSPLARYWLIPPLDWPFLSLRCLF